MTKPAPELGISKSFLDFLQGQGLMPPTNATDLAVVRLYDVHRAAGQRLTEALRRVLAATVERNAQRLGKAADVLRRWTSEQNIEGLAEWLDRGGDVDDAKLEAPFLAAAQATVAAKGDPAAVSLVMYGEGCALLAYALPREATRGPAFQPMVESFVRTYAAAFEDLDQPPPVIVAGAHALRAGLHAHDWLVLADLLHDADDADWLRVLARAWIKARKPQAEAEADALPLAIREKARTAAGHLWTPMARGLEIASALGGALEVNGEQYAHEPALAADAVTLRPRNLGIVPDDWLDRPAQMSLGFDAAAVPAYLVEASARTAMLARLPNMTPKLVPVMFAAAPQTDRMVKCTLGELTRMLYPGWKVRRATKHDLKTVGDAFAAASRLRTIEEQPNGKWRVYPLFTTFQDVGFTNEAEVGFALNPFLSERMQGGPAGGWFLLNMTRWLTLGIQNPRLFPLALRLAAMWDQARVNGHFVPGRLQEIEADRLLTLCNTLPPAAAEYRHGRTRTASGKAELAKARERLDADLQALEAAGLVGNWRPTRKTFHGRGWTLTPVPPDDYREACKAAVKELRQGRRKSGKN